MNRLALTLFAIALTLFPGCAGPGGGGLTIAQIVTPARIEAVLSLGAYTAAKAAIIKGHRAEIEAAQEALNVIAAAEHVDLPAVAAALEAAGVGNLSSTEGSLILGAVFSFADLWAGTAQPVLDSAQARAVVRGITHGFALALGPVPRGPGDPIMEMLVGDVIASRPAK